MTQKCGKRQAGKNELRNTLIIKVLQKAAKRRAKGILSGCKRMPFITQKAANEKTAG